MHAPALTLKDFCDAYRVCRETAYQQIRARRLRAVKLGRKTLILRADAEVWAASCPSLGPSAVSGHEHRQCPHKRELRRWRRRSSAGMFRTKQVCRPQ